MSTRNCDGRNTLAIQTTKYAHKNTWNIYSLVERRTAKDTLHFRQCCFYCKVGSSRWSSPDLAGSFVIDVWPWGTVRQRIQFQNREIASFSRYDFKMIFFVIISTYNIRSFYIKFRSSKVSTLTSQCYALNFALRLIISYTLKRKKFTTRHVATGSGDL